VSDVIFEEGSTGRELYVVLDGKIDIVKITGATKTTIVTLGKGEFFGEMAVIDGSSRSATAIARGPKNPGHAINHARFVYLVSQQPAFALMIMDALSKRLRASNAAQFKAQPNERPQAEPVSGSSQQRRLLADPGGPERIPDPFQEPRCQCLPGAWLIADHHDRRRAVLEFFRICWNASITSVVRRPDRPVDSQP